MDKKSKKIIPLVVISYRTCEKCKIQAPRDDDGNHICPKCGETIKNSARGW